jgi:hypothetical protein
MLYVVEGITEKREEISRLIIEGFMRQFDDLI